MKIQRIYMSAATQELDPIEITALLVKARKKNERLGVSGMLVYHEGSFLQILEGEEQVVNTLYEQIAQDDRHTNCSLLLRSHIDHRSFGDWTMGFVNTMLFGPKPLPGFNDFFTRKVAHQEFSEAPSMAQKLLLGFREGKWHQQVAT